LKVKESGETVDTTHDTVAKTAHIHRGDSVYGPKFVILGEGWIPKGLEEQLLGMDAGKSTTVELSPDKGYGARDPAKMRLVPLRKFREKGIDPLPGAQIEFDGRPAVVRAVGAGRVQVDYNHPLAGRTLIYDVSIEKVLEDENEKVLNIISRRIPEVKSDKFVLTREQDDLTVEVPEEAFYLSGLQIAKKAIAADIQKYFPAIGGISFREVFKKPSDTLQPQAVEATRPSVDDNAKPDQTTPSGESSETEKVVKPRGRPPTRKTTAGASHRRVKAGSENQR
jgi:FKBP-type peptidyl-prolyl cis-trans isomerase SlyD